MKRISSGIAPIVSYTVITFFTGMIIATLVFGKMAPGDLLKVLLLGYLPMCLILIKVISLYKTVLITNESDLIIKNVLTGKQRLLEKKDVIKIAPLNFLRKSPTYFIKYKKEGGKTGYHLFTKELFSNIESDISLFRP